MYNLLRKSPCKWSLVTDKRTQQLFVGLQDMSWRRIQDVFRVTIFCLPGRLKTSWRCLVNTSWRRLEDIWQDVLKKSWIKNCYAEDVLKTFSRHVLKTSWRHLLKTSWRHVLKTSWRQTKCLLGISVSNHGLLTNLNQYLTNLYLTNLYFTNLRRIQNALIRTQ